MAWGHQECATKGLCCRGGSSVLSAWGHMETLGTHGARSFSLQPQGLEGMWAQIWGPPGGEGAGSPLARL